MSLCLNARDAVPQGGRLLIESEMTELDESYCRQRDLVPGSYAVISIFDNAAWSLRRYLKPRSHLGTSRPLQCAARLPDGILDSSAFHQARLSVQQTLLRRIRTIGRVARVHRWRQLGAPGSACEPGS